MKKIFKFEAKQLLRDKKTIFFVFILPLIAFPLLNGVLSKVVNSRIESIFEQKATVIVQRDSLAVEVLSKFKATLDEQDEFNEEEFKQVREKFDQDGLFEYIDKAD